MKSYQLIVLASTALAAPLTAFGFAEFARGEALLSTTARATYDSRVFGGTSPADDIIFTLDPRLIYRREAGMVKLEGILGTRINRYYDFSELDSEDLVTSLRLHLPPQASSLASGSFLASYDEHTDVNYDVNRRVREKTFLTRMNADLPLGLKTAVLLGGSFQKDQRNQFSDRELMEGMAGFRYADFLGGSTLDLKYRRLEVETTGGNEWGIPLDQSSDIYSATLSRPLYHEVRGSVTYGYRQLQRSRTEVPGDRSIDDGGSLFSVGIEGPFLPTSMFPKVESSLSLGYQEAETPGINDTGGSRFFGAMDLRWQARERTRLTFNARRALELSVNDLTVETTSARIGVNQQIGNFMTGSLAAGYEQRDYRTWGRQDDAMIFESGLHYRITKTWSASAEYRLRATDSDNPGADYSRHLVFASVNYTF